MTPENEDPPLHRFEITNDDMPGTPIIVTREDEHKAEREMTTGDGPAPPAPPPLAESLLALGLIALVACSVWMWYGPLIRRMWQMLMKR